MIMLVVVRVMVVTCSVPLLLWMSVATAWAPSSSSFPFLGSQRRHVTTTVVGKKKNSQQHQQQSYLRLHPVRLLPSNNNNSKDDSSSWLLDSSKVIISIDNGRAEEEDHHHRREGSFLFRNKRQSGVHKDPARLGTTSTTTSSSSSASTSTSNGSSSSSSSRSTKTTNTNTNTTMKKAKVSDTDAGTLIIEFPATGLNVAAAVNGAFSLAWFSAIIPATVSGGIAVAPFFLPFWLAGGIVAKNAFVDPFINTRLTIGEFGWSLQSTIGNIGGESKEHIGSTDDLLGASVVAVVENNRSSRSNSIVTGDGDGKNKYRYELQLNTRNNGGVIVFSSSDPDEPDCLASLIVERLQKWKRQPAVSSATTSTNTTPSTPAGGGGDGENNRFHPGTMFN